MKEITIVCACCGKSATIKKSKSKPNKYCSKECALKIRYDKRKARYMEGLKTGILDGKPLIFYFYNRYAKAARSKSRIFALSLDQFKTFWQLPCVYCASAIDTIGIDRKNSSIGYDIDNCVPCCTKCNLMKRHIGVNDFISHCKSIAANN